MTRNSHFEIDFLLENNYNKATQLMKLLFQNFKNSNIQNKKVFFYYSLEKYCIPLKYNYVWFVWNMCRFFYTSNNGAVPFDLEI